MELTSLDALETDEILRRRMGTVGNIPLPPPLSTPNGPSTDSSIGPASVDETAPASSSRPQLTPPFSRFYQGVHSPAPQQVKAIWTFQHTPPSQDKPVDFPAGETKVHPLYAWMKNHERFETLVNTQADLFAKQVKQDMEEIERLEADKIAKLREAAQKMQSEKTWGTLANVAQYLMSGSTVVIGVAIVGAAPWAGGLLLASGALGLGHRVLHDTGAFQAIAASLTKSQELEKQIATNLEMGMLTLSAGLGLAGGAWAHGGGLLSAANSGLSLERLASGLAIGSSVGKGAAQFGGALTHRQTANLNAAIQENQTATNETYQNLYERARETQKFADSAAELGDTMKEMIESARVEQE